MADPTTAAAKVGRPGTRRALMRAASRPAPRARLGYPQQVDDAAVVMSEPVTNAVAAAPRGPSFVALPTAAARLVVEVYDLSPESPVPRVPDVLAPSTATACAW